MRKFLTILGAFAFGAIVLGVIGLVFILVKGPELDRESRIYAESSISAICKDWNKQELLKRESPEFMQAMAPGGTDKLFATYERLGHMTYCDPVKANANTSFIIGRGLSVRAECTTHANFQNGSAAIRLILIKRGKEWQILRIDVNSPLFVKP